MGNRTHEEKPWKGDTTVPHSLADLLIQVIFSTKDRLPNLDNNLRSRLFPYSLPARPSHGPAPSFAGLLDSKGHVRMG